VRVFGRQYSIQRDDENECYRVKLGQQLVAIHSTPEGAKALAVLHAHQVSLPQSRQHFVIAFGNAR